MSDSSAIVLDAVNNDTLFFEVASHTRKGMFFDVWVDKVNHWICTCENYYYRKHFCKHMNQVREYYDTYLADEFPEFHDVIHSDTVYNDVRGSVVYGCSY